MVTTRAGASTSSYIFAFSIPFSLILVTALTALKIGDNLDKKFLEEVLCDLLFCSILFVGLNFVGRSGWFQFMFGLDELFCNVEASVILMHITCLY